MSGSVTIIGGGVLNLESEWCGLSLTAKDSRFNVAKATVNVKGKWGIVGGKAYNAYLELSDAAGELSGEGPKARLWILEDLHWLMDAPSLSATGLFSTPPGKLS